jgi:uncharacterized alpha-E superfamily protein
VGREAPLLEAVLEIADSAMTYRRRYMTTLQVAPVLDLLLADETNPRSVAFQLSRLDEHVAALPRGSANAAAGTQARRSPEERTLLRCLTTLRLADLNAESQVFPGGAERGRLDHLLVQFIGEIHSLSDALSQSYLSHAVASRQLSSSTHRPGEP